MYRRRIERVGRGKFSSASLLIFLNMFMAVFMTHSGQVDAQDLRFSQFYANRLYLNPAFAGSEHCPFVMAQYRNQWPGFGGAFVSYSASYDEFVDLISGGIGVMAVSDDLAGGAFNTTSFHAQYSYYFQATRNLSVQAGLEFSRVQRKIDPSGFILPDMIDRVTGEVFHPGDVSGRRSTGFFDFSTGAVAWYGNYFIGVAVHHLTGPDYSLPGGEPAGLDRKYTLHAGTSMPLSSGRPVGGLVRLGEVEFSPNFMYQQQGRSRQVNLGVYLSYQGLQTGVWLNQNLGFEYQSWIFLVGYVHPSFRLAYSHDLYYGFSDRFFPAGGAHEVSLSLPLACRRGRDRIRAVRCPTF